MIVRHARPLRRALAFAVVMFVAYAAGLGLCLWRVEAEGARNDARQGGGPVPPHLRVPDLLAWCVPEAADWSYAFSRYPGWMRTDPGFYAPVLWVVLGGASVGFSASAWIPAAAALPYLRGVPSSERRRAGRAWGVMLRRARRCRRTAPRWMWRGAAMVGGIGVAFLGDAWAMTVGHLRLEAAWARGAPGSVVHMEPVVGSLALPDAIAATAWAIFLPLGLVWLTTREAFMLRESRVGGRCPACGYPTPSGGVAGGGGTRAGEGAAPCPECGARPEGAGRPRLPKRRAVVVMRWGLGGVLVLALTAFCIVPRLTG